MLVNSSLESNSMAALQLSSTIGPYDGQPHNYADFEHNISLYYKVAADQLQGGNFSLNGASEWKWFAEDSIGPIHNSLTALLSIAVNLLVIILSFFSRHLTKDFRFFFANFALADMIYTLGRYRDYISSAYYAFVKKEPFHIDQCTVAVTNQVVFGASTIFAAFTTSFHRYNVIVKKNFTYFTKPKIAAICLLSYAPVLWPTYLIVSRQKFIYTTTLWCPFSFHSDFVNVKLLVLPVASVFLLHAYYLARLKYFLSKSLSQIAVQINKSVSEVKTEKRMLRAMMIQGILPCVSVSPVAIAILLAEVMKLDYFKTGNESFRDPLFGYTFLDMMIAMMHWSPFLDGMTTLFAMKTYRVALFTHLHDLKIALHGLVDKIRRCDQTRQNPTLF